MAGDVDLIIESIGQNGPAAASRVDLSGYDEAKRLKGVTRSLLNLSPGTTDDIGKTVDPTMAKIAAELGGDFSRLGAICVFGDSNGAGQTLAFAKALQGNRAPKPLYIGTGDVTMFPFGRQPGVPGIGTLTPKNAPKVQFGINMRPGFRGVAPNAMDFDVPKIDNPGLDAQVMENFLTEGGNRVRWFVHTPISPSGGWWWTSSMDGSEVHGAIEGGAWTNLTLPTTSSGSSLVPGPMSFDSGHHLSLCKLALPRMESMASTLLRGFVLKL